MASSVTILLNKILTEAAKRHASTIHLTVGAYSALRVDEELVELPAEELIDRPLMEKMVETLLDDVQRQQFEQQRSISVVQTVADKFRLRVNFFYQKGSIAAELRLIPSQPPPLINLGLPRAVYNLTERRSGLLIVSGPYGSGRTTTVASMIDEINKNRKETIITIEQPIEYLHVNKSSLIEQREVGKDANSFTDALRNCLESDVNLVSLSSATEPGVIEPLLQFAASGRLGIVQMEGISSVQVIETVLASFGAAERSRGQLLLSQALLAVIVQRLVPRIGGGQVLAAEVLIANEALRSLIREGRTSQIPTIVQSSRAEGMLTLDQSLASLVKSGEVLLDQAVGYEIGRAHV